MRWRAWLMTGAACALGGCERGMHDMYEQPKYKPLTPSRLFDDGNSSRPQVAGTVPYSAGALAASSSGRAAPLATIPPAEPAVGVDAQGHGLPFDDAAAPRGHANPMPITPQLVARGRGRFDIFCAPCHSRVGDGDGMVVRRGFPAPASFHTERLRKASDSYYFQVMSDGYGAMYPYADRITPEDRWAIVAYIRALQLSQHAPTAELNAQDVAKLSGRAR